MKTQQGIRRLVASYIHFFLRGYANIAVQKISLSFEKRLQNFWNIGKKKVQQVNINMK